jgi:hypothetical protein
MSNSAFWSLIDLISGDRWDDDRSDYSALEAKLCQMPSEQVRAFYEALAERAHALDTRANHAAFAYFPGLADTFLYARLAVIGNGEDVYRHVLATPSAFPARSRSAWAERLLVVPMEVYRSATGADLDTSAAPDLESFSNRDGWRD